MKLPTVTAACALLFWAFPAQARTHHHHHHYYHVAHHHHYRHYAGGGRPARWCGWYMRQVMGVADSAYNLARNWAHYGHPTSAHVGAIVVWSHHVGKIVGGSPGHWAILSGNDGHAVRTRVRSVAGAIAFRE